MKKYALLAACCVLLFTGCQRVDCSTKYNIVEYKPDTQIYTTTEYDIIMKMPMTKVKTQSGYTATYANGETRFTTNIPDAFICKRIAL